MKLNFNRMFLAIIFAVMPVFILANSIFIEVDILDLSLMIVLISGLIIMSTIKDKRLWIGLLIVSVMLLIFLIDFEMIEVGASNFVKRYRLFTKAYDSGNNLVIPVKEIEGMKYLVRCYLIIMIPCLYVVYNNKFWKMVYINVTVPFFVLCFAIGKVPGMMEIVIMAVMYTDVAVHHKGSDKRIHLNPKINEIMAKIVPICIALLVILIVLLNNKLHPYQRDKKLDGMKENINAYISGEKDFSFAELFGFDNGIAYGGISDGTLGDADELRFKGTEVLEIKMDYFENFKLRQNVYIKGYVGYDYNGNSWKKDENVEDEIEAIAEKYDVSTDVLENITYYSLEQLNMYNAEYSLDLGNVEQSIRMNIKNLNNDDKRYYYPYCSRVTEGEMGFRFMMSNEGHIYDSIGYLNNHRIDYDMFEPYRGEDVLSDMKDVEYLQGIMEEYSQLVYDEFMDVPESFKKTDAALQIEQFHSGEYSYDDSIRSNGDYYNDCITFVKDYLENRCTYTLKPGKLEKGKDFVQVFIDEKREGYCSHFASAAVLMFRSLGIPARYVEGFSVLTSDFSLDSSNDLLGKAKDNDAHAWVEIYCDDIGWIIVDPTPAGYRNVIDGKEKSTTKKPEQTTKQDTTTQPQTTTKKPEETTKQDMTTIPSQTSGSVNGTDGGSNGTANHKNIMPIVIMIMVISALGGLIVFIQCRAVNKQKKAFELINSKKYNKITKLIISELSYFMKCNGMEFDHFDSTKDLAKKIQLLCEVVDEDNTDEHTAKVIYKMKYSNEDTTEKDIKCVIDKMKAIVPYQYKKANIIRKIIIYYFKCLYLFDK